MPGVTEQEIAQAKQMNLYQYIPGGIPLVAVSRQRKKVKVLR